MAAFGERVITEVIKVKSGHMAGPWSKMMGALRERGGEGTDRQRDDQVRTQGERPAGSQPCPHPDLTPASRTGGGKGADISC